MNRRTFLLSAIAAVAVVPILTEKPEMPDEEFNARLLEYAEMYRDADRSRRKRYLAEAERLTPTLEEESARQFWKKFNAALVEGYGI